jgi:AmiR/NasT family two-component response regulator
MSEQPDIERNVVPLPARPEVHAGLEDEDAQLREAFARRIVIEQAKGAASARLDVTPDVAYELMRGLARSQGQDLHDFAAAVLERGGRLD